jgi:hypothetical protein
MGKWRGQGSELAPEKMIVVESATLAAVAANDACRVGPASIGLNYSRCSPANKVFRFDRNSPNRRSTHDCWPPRASDLCITAVKMTGSGWPLRSVCSPSNRDPVQARRCRRRYASPFDGERTAVSDAARIGPFSVTSNKLCQTGLNS